MGPSQDFLFVVFLIAAVGGLILGLLCGKDGGCLTPLSWSGAPPRGTPTIPGAGHANGRGREDKGKRKVLVGRSYFPPGTYDGLSS
jgi:hypothetical protein